ncbi:MAG: PilZ domain-containing protein [Candidatus Kuenenia sp.]|nr:PilZ domain-containing protein [Candidatus Kuenenia hertensis]
MENMNEFNMEENHNVSNVGFKASNEQLIHIEKRKHPRIEASMLIKIQIEDVAVLATTINISCSGIFCQTEMYIPIKSKVKLLFALPYYGDQKKQIEQMECCGEVVRVQLDLTDVRKMPAYNIAISFTNLNEQERKKIDNYIKFTP